MDDIVYYCNDCATQHRLPLGFGKYVAGYCRLCGTAAPYVGQILFQEAKELGINIPTLKELWE